MPTARRVSRKPGALAKALGAGSLLMLLWFVIHSACATWDGFRDDATRADVAVVLGNTVERDGRPSRRLRGRLDRAVLLHRSGAVRCTIVSGGRGHEGWEEADVMADYLVAAGIPRSEILVDRGGWDTCQTALGAARLMREHGYSSAIVVTQFHHVSRAKLAFARAGIREVSSAHARYYEARDLTASIREFFGYYYYLLRPWPPAQ